MTDPTPITSKPGRSRIPFPTLPVLLCFAVSAFLLLLFFRTVDLKPKVSENFFFSKNDPQVRVDNEIVKLFPESPRIILVATGNIQSLPYQDRVRALSDALVNVPGVLSVESLSRGPKDIKEAFDSELWTRLLIAKNQKSSYIIVNLKERTGEETIRRLEDLQRRFDRPGFELTMSGVPYVTELIARNLARDLRVFSLAAFCIFGIVSLLIF